MTLLNAFVTLFCSFSLQGLERFLLTVSEERERSMLNQQEIWKDILEFPDYSISNTGKVLNKITMKERKPIEHRYSKKRNQVGNEYLFVNLYYGQKQKPRRKSKMLYLHRLIAQAFIPNPENKPCINHKDCNKQNNKIENLEWVTYSENTVHGVKNGLISGCKGENCGKSKLTEEEVLQIREIYSLKKYSFSQIGKMFNIGSSNVEAIGKRKTWKHI